MDVEFGCNGAALMFWCHTAPGGKRGGGAARAIAGRAIKALNTIRLSRFMTLLPALTGRDSVA